MPANQNDPQSPNGRPVANRVATPATIDEARRQLVEVVLRDHKTVVSDLTMFVRLAAALPDDASHADRINAYRDMIDARWQAMQRILAEIP